jgi:uncharacterized protein
MAHRLTSEIISDEAALRTLIGTPNEVVRQKVAPRLSPLTRPFVERSPFLCIATSAPDGSCDVSPRGDPAGFVRILDDATLLIPERPGNKLADSLRNILRNPRVGLLFIIPGIGDTLRVNGRATLTSDGTLLAPSIVEGKLPKLGILVDVEEVYTHCSKAFLRSCLWDPARFIDRAQLPSSGAILREILGESFDGDKYEAEKNARYARRENFY